MNLMVIENKAKVAKAPSIYIGYGSIRVSKTLYEMMDKPEYVKFAVDLKERIVGIAIAKESDVGACKLNGKTMTAGASHASEVIRVMCGDRNRTYKLQCTKFIGEWFVAYVNKEGDND